MSAILAIFQRDNRPVELTVVGSMLAAVPQRAVDGQDVWVEGNIALAHQHFWVLPEDAGERQPFADPSGRYVISADVRLDNRSEIIHKLGLDAKQAAGWSDSRLLLHAYLRWGADCVAHLLGDYAFAVWDRTEQELFAARDALGARGLCYYVDSQVCIVASEILHILEHPAVPIRMNEGKVAEYLAVMWDSQDETLYEEIFYVAPAHCLMVTQDARRVWRYWDIDPEARVRYRSDAEYAEQMRALVSEAVRCRLRTHGPVGISLSGGLDSTSLAAIAASILAESGKRLHSFSYVFDELTSCDEREYIRPLVEQFSLDATYLLCDGCWTLRDLSTWPVERDFVFHDAFFWLPYTVMQAAHAASCRVLLAGHFGDMLFAGGCYWAADLLRDRRWQALAQIMLRERRNIDWGTDLGRHGLRPLAPQALKRAFRRLRPAAAHWSHPGLHPDFVTRTQLAERSRPQAPPDGRWASDRWERYRSLMDASMPQGQVSVRRLYHGFGIELENPLYDRRLVEFIMALPADQLGRPGRTRWIMRNAMDALPAAVRERSGKTTFTPLFDRGMHEREMEVLGKELRNGELTRRRIIATSWLETQMDPAPAQDSSRVSLWLCVCLELWLCRWHVDAAKRTRHWHV